jgi:hypothetical protein
MAEQNKQLETTKGKEVIRAEFNVSLQRAELGYAALQNIKNNLVINEDNLTDIKNFLELVRKAKKVIEDTHKKEKAQYWEMCTKYDESKREMDKLFDGLMADVNAKYTNLCSAIERRRQEADAKRKKEDDIKKGIENNLLHYTQLIAEAKTSAQIVDIEKKLHLEKTRKDKYGEFLSLAIERYDTLAGLIKEQKVKVKALEVLTGKLEKAKQDGDADAMLDLEQKIDDVKEAVAEGNINLQEYAINEATKVDDDIINAEEILPAVKTRRTTIKSEAIDIKTLFKKLPHLVNLVLNDEEVKKFVKTKVAEGALNDVDEINVFGLRIYKEKLF